jgi:hypothetical protein
MEYNKCIRKQNVVWPPNRGCSSTEENILLVPLNYKKTGREKVIFVDLIDRFGPETGYFFSDAGNTWTERSLPWFENKLKCKSRYHQFIRKTEYHQYKILKPFLVKMCKIAPAFGAKGGGIQYWSDKNIKFLLDNGFLKELNNHSYPNFNFGVRKIIHLLQKQKYTSKLSDRRKFKKLVTLMERKTNKISKPGIKILTKHGKACVRRSYWVAVNNKDSFKLIKKNFNLRNCKKPELIIFLHIHNRVTGKEHLNLLIVNLKNKTVSRIDPSSPNGTKITEKKVKKELGKYFKQFGYNYIGLDYRSKVIKHGKLCRYAVPAEYIYGRKLNHRILKKFIINYFKYNG